MRSWHPIHPRKLDRQHLLGEHVELHVLFKVISEDQDGWRHHPERKRWEGHLPALVARHDMIVKEMLKRGYNHESPLPKAKGSRWWPRPWQPLSMMNKVLESKQEKGKENEKAREAPDAGRAHQRDG